MDASTITSSSPSQQPETIDLMSSPDESKSATTSVHPLLSVLLTRKQSLGNMKQRIEKISNLLKIDVERFLLESLDKNSSSLRLDVQTWYKKNRVLDKSKHKWRMENVASALCEFDVILSSFLSKIAVADQVIPSAIKTFQEYMSVTVTDSNTILQVEKSARSKPNKKRYGDQRSGTCHQDSISMSSIKPEDYESIPCARCNHGFLYALEPAEEINANNLAKKEQFEKSMREWNNAKRATRGPKPRKPQTESQTLVCMCIRITCKNKSSGIGCSICKTACDNAKKERTRNILRRPLTDENHQCLCDVCTCQCTAMYKRNEHKSVAYQAAQDASNKSKSMTKSKSKFLLSTYCFVSM